jgi:hypothetical protein
VTYHLIDDKREEIPRLRELVAETEGRKRKGELDLVEFEKSGVQSTEVMAELARQKFTAITDVQLMVNRCRIQIKVYIYIYIHIYIYKYMYVYIYMYLYVYIYIYV